MLKYKNIQQLSNIFESWISSYRVVMPNVMFKKDVLDSLDYWLDKRFSMIEEFQDIRK